LYLVDGIELVSKKRATWPSRNMVKTVSQKVKQLSTAIANSLNDSVSLPGLVYVEEHNDLPGFTRKSSGKNFVYLDVDGTAIRDEEIVTRIKALAIPPAWTKVWICPATNGHLQATGRDTKGRKQYLYHPDWRTQRDAAKFDHLAEFGERLPRLRRLVNRDMRERSLRKARVIATIVRLLEQSLIRVGNDEYAKENESYGLSTLKNRHALVKGDQLVFQFKGKSGIYHAIKITDGKVARTVKRCQDLPGQRLFRYYDETGELRDVRSEDVNEYIQQSIGPNFSTKDFRTWAGSAFALSILSRLDRPTSKRQAQKEIGTAIKQAAQVLGNTPAVCRRSYIHPAILEEFVAGRLTPPRKPVNQLLSRSRLSFSERQLLRFLRRMRRKQAIT
jgi:DNA topoisomerase I